MPYSALCHTQLYLRLDTLRLANAAKAAMHEKDCELRKQELEVRKQEAELAKTQAAAQSNMLMMMVQAFTTLGVAKRRHSLR